MRVLLMVHQFLPEHVAGTELVTLDVAKGLVACGHEVEIFAGFPVKRPLADGERFDAYEFEGLRVHRFLHQFVPMGGQKNIVELEYDNRLFADYLRRYLREKNFGRGDVQDVVHFFHMGRLGASAVDVCLEAGVVTCFTPTDFWGICPFSQLRLPDGKLCGGPDVFSANCLRHSAEVEGKKSLLKVLPDVLVAAAAGGIREGVVAERWYSDFVRALVERPGFIRARLNRMDAILPPSRFMLEMLGRNGIHVSRMKHVRHGANVGHIRRNVLRGGGEMLRVGFLGTLAEHKGAHVLVEAVKLLPPEVKVAVHFHGKLREFPAYAERLEEMTGGDERFVFHGAYGPEKVGEVLESVDVVVVPSLWYENSPLVIQAAQAAGCPVVASDAGGMAELVSHKGDGVLFEMGNAAELSRVIVGLARNRSEVRRLAENSPVVKCVGKYVLELEELYQGLARERQK